MKKISILILLVCLSAITRVSIADDSAAVKIAWGYLGNTGPSQWGNLSPAFALCSGGKSQSPINIKAFTETDGFLKFNYHPAPLRMIEDGTTELMIGSTKTIINDGHTLQVNFGVNSQETIVVDNETYHLVQFHFHSPSETKIKSNVFPLEIHFVHQGPGGKVAVVAVLVKNGEANPTLQKIIKYAPPKLHTEYELRGESIHPGALLPEKYDFYRYMGSLTTPPCTEGLIWFVMGNNITASPAQVLRIRTIIDEDNARPVQPLFNRAITHSTNS